VVTEIRTGQDTTKKVQRGGMADVEGPAGGGGADVEEPAGVLCCSGLAIRQFECSA